jgi:PAS domain S-box-containing protein
MNGIKILYLEDSEFDIEIVRYLFEQEKIEFNLQHANNREDFIKKLEDFRPDIVLANISIPSFEGIEALHIVQEKNTELPVIFLSGVLGEEHLIEVLKNGATDYVLKHRLGRLIPAVRRALLESNEKAKRIQAEEALRGCEARYRMLFDHSSEAIILEKDKKIHTFNSTTLDFFLESKNNIINRSILDFSAKIQADGIASAKRLTTYRKKAKNGKLAVFDWLLQLQDGSQIDAEIELSHSKLGTDEFYQYFIHDMSERKKADALQKMLYTAIEQSAEIVCITGADGIIEYVNSAYLKVTGYKMKELIGKSFNVMSTKEHPDEFYDQIAECIARENNWRGNMKIRRKDGKSIEVYSSISPVRDLPGGIIKYVAVQRDITDETRIQNYLQRAQRLETIGTLAGGIAHDFNNILATIIGHTEITMEDLPKDHSSFHDLEQILKASNRAKDLVNKILSFSRQMEPKTEAVILDSFIQDVVRMLEGSIPKKISIKTKLDKKCPPVLVDPSHIHQVILNICTNAFYSMKKKGGTLFISVENQEVDDEFVKKYPYIRKGKYVRTDFKDTGIGMKQNIMERIFEPFFTTKPVGEGTGLGLSVVHGLIKNMKGEILVESKPGKGSTFSILLPAIKIHSSRNK